MAKKVDWGQELEKAEFALEALKIELVDIDFLKPNPYNPNRQNPDEFIKLKKSIIENGFKQPVIAKPDGEIVDGEHRWRACKDLGFKKIAVVFGDYDAIQQKLATIQFNEARGTEDMELLSKVMRDFEALGAGDRVKDSLSLDDEGWQRLLDYGGSVLDQFPGDQPGMAWEPADTATGSVQSYEEEGEKQSVSEGAQKPGAAPFSSSVPGLGSQDPNYAPPREQMVRRIFIFTKEEAEIIDSVLGSNAAKSLFEICKERSKANDTVAKE